MEVCIKITFYCAVCSLTLGRLSQLHILVCLLITTSFYNHSRKDVVISGRDCEEVEVHATEIFCMCRR